MTRASSLALALAALLVCTTAPASHAVAADDVDYDFYAWARYAAGAPKSSLRAGGGLYVRGPLAIAPKAQLGVGLAIESLPDKGSFSLADLGSWGNYAAVAGHGAYRVAERDVASGRISMSVIAWGRATFDSFGGHAPGVVEPRRAQRQYAGGLSFEHEKTDGPRSWLWVGWGTDDANRPLVSSPTQPALQLARFRQLLLEGSVHIKGPVYLDARTGLAFGDVEQPDYFIGGLRTSIADILRR